MKSLSYRCLALVFAPLFLFCSKQVVSQVNINKDKRHTESKANEQFAGESETIESEDEALLRDKWLYDMRKNADGIIDEQHRWDEFRKVRSASLNNRGALPSAQWMNLGPNTIDSMGGRMACHAFDPADNQTIWAGSGSGGLWRTTNGGASWGSMTDELPSLYISCITIKPTDRNVMLLGTGNFDQFGFTL